MSAGTTTALRPRGERRIATVLGGALSMVVSVAIVVMSGISIAASPAQERAVALLRSFVSGDVEPYRQSADPKLLKALPAAQLAAVFEDLSRQGGAFVRLGDVSSQTRDGFTMVEIPLQYERATQVARIVLDGQGRLAGLQIRPSAGAVAFRSAPYVDPSRFSEQAVVVDAGGWPLPGTLSIPTGPGPFPAVVLVHGSGPSDRDSSIGPNKLFRDLAEGLASRGIVVLRYEKRSREHAARLGTITTLTPREEVIDDVLAAVRLLREHPSVRPASVFIAGHSFGGTLAPAIAAADGKLAGVILLAGANRPMEDTIISQTRYLAQLDGEVTPAEATQLKELEALAREVRALKRPSDRAPKSVTFSAPTSYWLALRELEPTKTSASLQAPTLVLQGERDYQVTMGDFATWRTLLAHNPSAEFKSLPRLNHAFMPGEGPSSPAEYSIPNHVDVTVIDVIAEWVTRVAATPSR